MTESTLDTATSNGEDRADTVRTPTLISPPETHTPPTEMHKRNRDGSEGAPRREASEAIDADALSRALEEFDGRQRAREHTPEASPRRKRQRVIGDRYVEPLSLYGCANELCEVGRFNFEDQFICVVLGHDHHG